ncbi:hypothetical protein HUT19_29935 [Streptomyces sp. NA02950]|uniref:hypothetical protein n=1 Tax=Streptomyces sp. NA02950 TaxID=2742137 RepID=UPI001590BF15|nr:hypothetical protein [Streptomyces sp. NA02950]QKV95433.1 hypothetical protein HUT19_29935 [Streptomyces sp. NA02950]
MAERDSNENEADARRDDDAAFAEIVAAYGEEPPDPPEAERWPVADNLVEQWGRERPPAAPDPAREDDTPPDGTDGTDGTDGGGPEGESRDDVTKPVTGGPGGSDKPVGSFIVYAPGVGPRDWEPEEPSEDDFDESDEGHFVPPEPPPLPESDTTSRFAWLGVLGGPLLLIAVVVFRLEMTWWITTLGVGGFLGGFATLVMRMKDGADEEDDDPGRGAVV